MGGFLRFDSPVSSPIVLCRNHPFSRGVAHFWKRRLPQKERKRKKKQANTRQRLWSIDPTHQNSIFSRTPAVPIGGGGFIGIPIGAGAAHREFLRERQRQGRTSWKMAALAMASIAVPKWSQSHSLGNVSGNITRSLASQVADPTTQRPNNYYFSADPTTRRKLRGKKSLPKWLWLK